MEERRIIDLEVKVSFLENHIAELDSVVRDVNERMEQLRRELAEMQVQSAGTEKQTPESERPPHY